MNEANMDLKAKFQDLDQLWNAGNVPASEAAFRALLQDADTLAKDDPGPLIELLSLIGRSEAFQGRFSEARKSLDRAERILNEQPSACRVSSRLRWLLEKGRFHILEKTPSQARPLFSEAWSLALNSGEDYFAVEIAQLMAATEPQKAQHEWLIRAIEIAETSPLPRTKLWLGSLYTSLGWRFFDLREFDKALETFQKALRHLKARGSTRDAFVAQWSIGKVLRALGRTEEALAIQKTLLAELGIGGERDGRLYEELGECLQSLNRTTEAQLYFELAYRELSSDEWITDNQPLKLKRLKELGKVK